jgi:amicyanin
MRRLRFLLLAVLMVAGLAAAVSCGAAAMPAPSPAAQTKPPAGTTPGPDFKPAAVTIQNFAYSPATLTVPVGTTVTWTNEDSVRHTVTTRTSLFDSGLLSQGQTFSYTFNQKGTYDYYCTVHPYMTGKIIVE